MDEEDQRAAQAERTINALLQHSDSTTMLAITMEKHSLTLSAFQDKMERHTAALNDFRG